MISYNGTIYGLSDDVQFVKASGKKGRTRYFIYHGKSTYPLTGAFAKVFEGIVCLKIQNFSDTHVSEKAFLKSFSYFLESDWIREIPEDMKPDLTLSDYTYYTDANGKYYITNLLYKTVDIISGAAYSLIADGKYGKLPLEDLFYFYARRYLKDVKVTDEIYNFENQIEYKTVYILFSYDCNLKCKYCFEKRRNRSLDMSKEILDKSVRFIDNISIGSNVLINFFGGEPLLEKNRESIDEIFSKFRKNNNVYFRFITNGVNAKQFINVFEPVKRKIKSFVITLDGTREIHDKRRAATDSHGSFDAVIEAIDILSAHDYPVVIRTNIDEGNYHNQDEYIRFLNKRFRGRKGISIEYHRVEEKSDIDCRPTSYLDCYMLYKRIKKISRFNVTFNLPVVALLNSICESSHSFPQVKKSYCTLASNYVIDYDGQVYSCHEATGVDSFKIGAVERELKKGCEMAANENCRTCVFYMGCYGGCPLESYYYKEQTGCGKCSYNDMSDTIKHFFEMDPGMKKLRIGKG